jgi:hypothetical protein
MTTAKRTDPKLWEQVKAEVRAGDRGGRPGQWSARKAQMAVQRYKALGGGYIGSKDPDNSLVRWTEQRWRTKSGRPSLETGERYLPAAAIEALSDAEYAETTRRKREGMKRGQQFVAQPVAIAEKVAPFRTNGRPRHRSRAGDQVESVATKIDGRRVVVAFFRTIEDAPETWNVAAYVGATRRIKKYIRMDAWWPTTVAATGSSSLAPMLWVAQELDAFQRRHPERTLIVRGGEPRRQRAYQALRRRGFRVGWYRGGEVLFRDALA